MKRLALVLLVPLILATPALAAKPAAVTITRSDDAFVIEIVRPQNVKNPFSLWVTSTCYVDNVPNSVQHLPVRYDPPDDPEPTSGVAGPFVFSGESCAVWVWYFPSPDRPISDVLTFVS